MVINDFVKMDDNLESRFPRKKICVSPQVLVWVWLLYRDAGLWKQQMDGWDDLTMVTHRVSTV